MNFRKMQEKKKIDFFAILYMIRVLGFEYTVTFVESVDGQEVVFSVPVRVPPSFYQPGQFFMSLQEKRMKRKKSVFDDFDVKKFDKKGFEFG